MNQIRIPSDATGVLGSTSDTESVSGNGSVIAILKRQRTLLGSVVVLLGAGLPALLVGGRLDVSIGAFNAAFPTGQNHIGRVAVDSILGIGTSGQKTMANSVPMVIASDQTAIATTGSAADSTQLRTGQKHAGRVAIDTILAGQNHIGRVAVDTIIDKTVASSNVIGTVSLGNTTGKTATMKTGTLTTTATTADQVVLTYTVTGGKTFYLEYVSFEARLTTLSATASILGTISLELPSGTKVITHSLVNGTTELDDQVSPYAFGEPIPLAAASVIRCVTTPAAVTSMVWICNFGGYEK